MKVRGYKQSVRTGRSKSSRHVEHDDNNESRRRLNITMLPNTVCDQLTRRNMNKTTVEYSIHEHEINKETPNTIHEDKKNMKSSGIIRWIPDNASKSCQKCNRLFGLIWRRHHCRLCGQLICKQCSTTRSIINRMSCYSRTCVDCLKVLSMLAEQGDDRLVYLRRSIAQKRVRHVKEFYSREEELDIFLSMYKNKRVVSMRVFIVESSWIYKWLNYVNIKARGSQHDRRPNGDSPGPITNFKLLHIHGNVRPKQNLRISSTKETGDFCIVNECIWAFWHKQYGGGPAILIQGDEKYKDRDSWVYEEYKSWQIYLELDNLESGTQLLRNSPNSDTRKHQFIQDQLKFFDMFEQSLYIPNNYSNGTPKSTKATLNAYVKALKQERLNVQKQVQDFAEHSLIEKAQASFRQNGIQRRCVTVK